MTCSDCHGKGMIVQIRQIGPGMIQQMQSNCHKCRGQGRSIPDTKKCRDCIGKGSKREDNTLEAFVTKGMKQGDKLNFPGEGDEEPGVLPADVVMIIQEKEHDRFKREGIHLFYRHTISLVDALTGFKSEIPHLDGRTLVLQTLPKNPITKPNQFRVIKGEGMPDRMNPTEHGNLYIEFVVQFPDTMDSNLASKLRQLLPVQKIPQPRVDRKSIDADMELEGGNVEVEMEDIDMTKERRRLGEETKRRNHEARQSAHDEDDEEEGHMHHGPQCHTQ